MKLLFASDEDQPRNPQLAKIKTDQHQLVYLQHKPYTGGSGNTAGGGVGSLEKPEAYGVFCKPVFCI